MADPHFFKRSGPYTLNALAEKSGSVVFEGSDPDLTLHDVAPLDQAQAGQISFLDNAKYKEAFTNTAAGAVIIHPDMAVHAPKGTALLCSPSPYKSYARIAALFYPEEWPEPYVSDFAYIDPSAKIGKNCIISPHAVIGRDVEIGDDCWIEPHAVIADSVKIGHHVRIGPNSSVSHSIIGDFVRLYPGVCIGQDGFGFAIDPNGYVKVPQLGRVLVGSHVEIGSNTCIDRGAGPDTVIGDGTWIDNLVQIGHNVKIGKGCVIVSQVGISGSTVLEDYVMLGGQAGVAGHLQIGKGSKVAAQSGVMRNIPPGEDYMGSPAMPMKQFMRQITHLKKMTKTK